MNRVKAPRSLRRANGSGCLEGTPEFEPSRNEIEPKRKVAVACLIAAGSITSAEAQQASSALPAVTVDAPVARHRPPAPKPSVAQVKARTAIRRQARVAKPVPVRAAPRVVARSAPRVIQAAPSVAPPSAPANPGLPVLARAPDANPYADPKAPYKADRLASQKFTEPLVNTPRSVTVLTKELLQDKNATSLKEIGRSTAGVTIGTGEGGNAFGDRFFIRGFDVRNDVFVDGIRDPGVSIRENFFTEQVEILRGPASSFAGRGTAGGAINIVTKQAADVDFYNADAQLGTDATRRVTIDINKAINPILSVRVDGLFQEADVAGRNFIFDNRWGGGAAVKFTPTDDIKITASYLHTDLDALPDFGVPYNAKARAPFTDTGVPRETFYGFVNRDFQKTTQDLGTLYGEYRFNNNITLDNKFRAERSILNYIGTLPEAPVLGATLDTTTVRANPQSRYQVTDVLADQTDAAFKYDFGAFHNTAVIGAEVDSEKVSRDTYKGLSSEALPGGFNGTGSVTIPILNPPNLLPFGNSPQLVGNPVIATVDTKSGYGIDTLNYRDFVILNGGIRYDDYDVRSRQGASTVGTHDGLVNYNAGIVVKPLPNASVYAAYATSSNPVGAELDGGSALYGALSPTVVVNQVFSPEENKAAEVGTKWEFFDRRLLATAALFQTTKDNAREVIPNGSPGAGQIIAGASYQVRGIDLGLSGNITDQWSVFAGAVFLDTKVTKSIVPARVGLELANVSHESFSLLTKYKINPILEVGGQAIYGSKEYGGTLAANPIATIIPSHWRFDTFVEMKVNPHFTVKLIATNIFDKLYYDAFYQSAAPFVFVAPGRTVSLVGQARF